MSVDSNVSETLQETNMKIEKTFQDQICLPEIVQTTLPETLPRPVMSIPDQTKLPETSLNPVVCSQEQMTLPETQLSPVMSIPEQTTLPETSLNPVMSIPDQATSPETTEIHPFDDCDTFKKNPPIPVMNLIIDSRTGQILEDRNGLP